MTYTVTPQRGGSRLIFADPPWEERGGGKIKRGADRHYPLLSTPEIIAVMLRATWADGSPAWNPDPRRAHVWIWVTDNFLEEGLFVMKALGVRYVRTRVWGKAVPLGDGAFRKEPFGLGQYSRNEHEIALFGVVGSLPPAARNIGSLPLAPRGRHSAKPDEFYSDAERIAGVPTMPDLRAKHECVEFFGRAPRPGWSVWGNEVDAVAEPR